MQKDFAKTMHPKVGADILARLDLEDPAPMLVAGEHHMHPDGSGYPDRESDYVPHPYSRIVQIADRYENFTDPQEDEIEALTPDKAMVQVLRDAGSADDPFFARLFAGALGVFPIGCMVRLSNHSVGVVSRPGEDPFAPTVRMAFDERGMELEDPYDLDLAATEQRIVEVVDPDTMRVAISEKL
jgi:HD-GYP domain-containing protein (c-di-GMP phosphodiesterase class II)